jgi:FHA domain
MTELTKLVPFVKENAKLTLEEFEAAYNGAFLVFRIPDTPPAYVFLPREAGFKMTIGRDESADLTFETDEVLDPVHLSVAYHPGFYGWVVEDNNSEFGTHVAKVRMQPGKVQLLLDLESVKASELLKMQFYSSNTLFARITKGR